MVSDIDISGEVYPIRHYVGYTASPKYPPIKRIVSHGAMSRNFVADIRPGTLEDEAKAKELEACPKCGKSLWYFGESPRAVDRFQVGDVVTRGKGKIGYEIIDGRPGRKGLLRPITVPSSGLSIPRTVPLSTLTLRQRNPDSYLAFQQALQGYFRQECGNTHQEEIEQLRTAALRAWPGQATIS
ncbi:hypothetical protein ACQCSU_14510 [Pseudarthrobacter sp. O4]|uniref:hypothetical protein n=1 Tax=Pseudarthrobacter sp. O4 TaxID=3418417 RepID=UPI003CEE08A8